MGKGKLTELEEQLEELEASVRACIARREALAQKGRRLAAKLKTAEPQDRPALRERIQDIRREYAEVQSEEKALATRAMNLRPTVVAMRRRLRTAESNVATLEDPPAWFDRTRQGISPHSLRQLERKARQTIRELMG